MDEYALIAAVNGSIALAYAVLAVRLAPRLGLPRAARAASVAVFSACALVHVELVARGLGAHPAWLGSARIAVLQLVHAVFVWWLVSILMRRLDVRFAWRLSPAAAQLADGQPLPGHGTWEYNPRRDRIRPSPGLVHLLGRPPDWTPRLDDLLAVVVPEDRAAARQALCALAGRRSGPPAELEFRVRRADGAVRVLATRAKPSRGRVVAATQDVTERRAAERAQEAAARERRIAETLQRSLLPGRLPDVPALELAALYLPGGEGDEIGGDWYDVIELPRGDVALVMGDVVGRGIRAAALVAKLRNALRAYVAEGHAPEQALGRLNALVDRTAGEMATVLVLTVTPGTGTLRWVSAGHPPPLLRAADGARRFLEGGRSVPLGAVAHARYEAAAGRAGPGDAVLLYTDGLVERRGVPLDESLARLRESATSNGSAVTLCDATVGALLPAGAGDDDVAVLAALLCAPEPALELTLDALPESLAPMRRRLRAWLRGQGVAADTTEAVLVCANEAASNAIEHAYGPDEASFELRASAPDGRVVVEVGDRGCWRPPRTGDGGRGLRLMRELAASFDLAPGPDGTRVRMEWPR